MKKLIVNILMLVVGVVVGTTFSYKMHFSLIHNSDVIQSLISESRLRISDDYNDVVELNDLLLENGFVLSYEHDYFKEYNNVLSYCAISNDYSIELKYCIFEQNAYADECFEAQKLSLESLKTDDSYEVKTDTNTKKHSKFAVVVDDEYKVVSKIGDLVLYALSDANNKKLLDSILKDIGF